MEELKKVCHIILKQEFTESSKFAKHVNGSEDIMQWSADCIGDRSSEVLLVIGLDVKNFMTGYSELFKGSINQSIAHPREIMQFTLLTNSASIILAHNHPSGNCKPSQQDIDFCDRMNDVCSLMGIRFLDNVIVTSRKEYECFSFRENGLLF